MTFKVCLEATQYLFVSSVAEVILVHIGKGVASVLISRHFVESVGAFSGSIYAEVTLPENGYGED